MALGPLERAGIVEAIEGPAKAPWLRGRLRPGDRPVRRDSRPWPRSWPLTSRPTPARPSPATLQVLLGRCGTRPNVSALPAPASIAELYERLRKGGILLRDFLDQQLNALGDTHPEAAESGFALDLLEYPHDPVGHGRRPTRAKNSRSAMPHRIGDMESVLEPSQGTVPVDRISGVSRSDKVRARHTWAHGPGALRPVAFPGVARAANPGETRRGMVRR